MQLPADDAITLALLYHLNSGVWSNTETNANIPYEMLYKTVPDPQPVKLVSYASPSDVGKLIEERRSCRRFARAVVPFDKISKILNSSYGTTGLRDDAELPWPIWARAVPSAGGLYPLEIYAAIRNVESVSEGVYHFNPVYQQLERLSRSETRELCGSLFYPESVDNANLLLVISAVFLRTMKKYGPRGYRYILLEAGHCAQNICLLSAECGLATLCLGGFRDSDMNRALGLDGRAEAVIYCIAVGEQASRE